MNCGLRRTVVVSADALTDQVGGGATEPTLQLPRQTGVDQVLPRWPAPQMFEDPQRFHCGECVHASFVVFTPRWPAPQILEFEDPQRFRLR
jgi:hypothetical protein